MHELPITEGILKVATEAAGGRRIRRINLLVGDLSSIVDDSVQFYFDLLSKGTVAEGAALVFERCPATAACPVCALTFEARAPLPDACPRCGSVGLRVTGGRELRVESIEIDDAIVPDEAQEDDRG